LKSFKITEKLLAAKQQQKKITDINETCVKQLVMLLKPFKHVITVIQTATGPSLHLVSMCLETLKKSLSSFESLKSFNNEHSGTIQEKQTVEESDDDDIEDELEGKYFRKRF
jgi:hypothetical protein